jgi:hypothetical protein
MPISLSVVVLFFPLVGRIGPPARVVYRWADEQKVATVDGEQKSQMRLLLDPAN